MSDLGFNKIAGAVLATGLIIFGLNNVVAETMVTTPALCGEAYEEAKTEGHHVEKAGYCVEIVEPVDPNAAPVLPPDWGTLLPAADLAAGQSVFNKCTSCHKADATNGTGPGLAGVVGRKPGTHAGFAYSPAMVAYGAAHSQWTFDELYEFLAAPQKHIEGTKMTFVGLKGRAGPEQRVAVIAYLNSLGGTLPIPAPDPARQPQPVAAEGAPPAEGAAAAGPAAAPAPAAK